MTGMTKHLRASIVSAFALAILSGCAETSLPEASGKGSISAVNAIPGSPILTFLIEERTLGVAGYKGSVARQSFDDLSYNFNFDFRFVGDTETTRIATQFTDMVAEARRKYEASKGTEQVMWFREWRGMMVLAFKLGIYSV